MRAKQFSLRLECAYIWNRTKNDATRNLNFGRCIHDIPLLQWAFPYDDTVFWNRRRAAGAGGRRPAHYTRRLARDGCGNRTRSEERRVGKECRSWRAREYYKKKAKIYMYWHRNSY